MIILAPRFSSTTRSPTKSRIFGVSVGRRTHLQSLESDLTIGGIILELLFDQKLWNDQELNRNVVFEDFAVADIVIVCTSVIVIVAVIVIRYLLNTIFRHYLYCFS